jgi:hypothetical protein
MSILLSKLNPFAPPQKVPSMADIATQIGYVASCRQIERTKLMADMYILASVNQYSTLDFKCFDELRQLGLETGRKTIKEARKIDSNAKDKKTKESILLKSVPPVDLTVT